MAERLGGRVRVVDEGVLLGVADKGGMILMGWGGGASAPTPMETLLLSLGGCTAIDIYKYLRERGARIKVLEVMVEAERVEEEPRRVVKARLTYSVEASGTSEAEVKEAVKASMQRYCSVGATLKTGGVELETRIKYKRG